ncbi:MAG: NAD-dependent epimerase/dehydratase family protein [Candidatus Paceibacterota bacterium]
MKDKRLSNYKGKKVLITGGAGFIGSNLAHELIFLGAEVTILDSLHPLYGGNIFNLEGINDKVNFVKGDIRDEKLVNELVKEKDLIFDLAAQVSYIDSLSIPFEDLDVNCQGHLVVLEACRNFNKGVKIIFPSSRTVYGKSNEELITENSLTNPPGLYAVHKLAAENYLMVYCKEFGVKSVVLRITNPYGVRQQIKHGKYSLPGWFIRLAMDGQTIKIFGDGNQLRDYIYISDLIDILLLAGIDSKADSQIFNCGSGIRRKFKEMAELAVKIVGSGSVEYVSWPENYNKVETGDSALDVSKLKKVLDWSSKVSLEEGLQKTFDYYKENKNNYI